LIHESIVWSYSQKSVHAGELFNIEISRPMSRYDTLNNIRGEKGKIYHPGNIAFIHAFP
jgi:hypothetical protein